MMADEVNDAFWSGSAREEFLLQHDPNSGRSQFFPRCVNVYSEAATEWRPARGTGTLVAVTTSRVAAPGFTPPYMVGIVRLDEGPRVFAPLLNAPPDVAPGRRMRVVWQETGGAHRLYAFAPDD
jgi:uncharacterized OB-fold protein